MYEMTLNAASIGKAVSKIVDNAKRGSNPPPMPLACAHFQAIKQVMPVISPPAVTNHIKNFICRVMPILLPSYHSV